MSKLESLLESAWNKKLWVLGWAAFAYSISFLYLFYDDLPNQRARIKNYEITTRQYVSDALKFADFGAQIKEFSTAFQKMDYNFRDRPNLFPTSKENRVKAIRQDLTIISDLKRKTAIVLGTLKGSSFQTSLFADFNRGYLEDIETIYDSLELFENFYIAYVSEEGGWNSKAEEVLASQPRFDEARASLSQRYMNSYLQANAVARQVEIEDISNRGKNSSLGWKFLLALVAIVYVLAFLVVAFVTWRAQPPRANRRRTKRRQNRNVSTRRLNLVPRLENFAEHINSKKVWVVASLIFAACFWFVVDVVSRSPEEVATFERFDATVDLSNLDMSRIQEIGERLREWLDMVSLVNNTTGTLLGHLDQRQSLSRDALPEEVMRDHKMLIDSRQELNVILGLVKGIRFQNPAYNDCFRDFAPVLRDFDSGLDPFEKFYVALLTGAKDAIGIDKELASKSTKFTIAGIALQELIKGVKRRLDAISNQIDVEREQEQAKLDRLFYKWMLVIPAVLFQVSYVLTALITWRKLRPKAHRQK